MTAVQWPCTINAHDACLSSSRSCGCTCHRTTFTERAAYLAWRGWDRLLDKALDCWEIRTVSGDPLVENSARESAEARASGRPVGPVTTLSSTDPVPSSPRVAPAAAEPPSESEADATSDSGGGSETTLEELRRKVALFDSRHPSLLGPL